MIHRVTTSDNKWQWEVPRVATNDNEWQLMTASDKTSDKKWQQMTSSDNDGMVISANFLFCREEPINRHPKENSLNLKENLEEDLLK